MGGVIEIWAWAGGWWWVGNSIQMCFWRELYVNKVEISRNPLHIEIMVPQMKQRRHSRVWDFWQALTSPWRQSPTARVHSTLWWNLCWTPPMPILKARFGIRPCETWKSSPKNRSMMSFFSSIRSFQQQRRLDQLHGPYRLLRDANTCLLPPRYGS